MSSSAIFLLQAFVIIVLPVALLRFSGLKSIMPLVVMQIMLGVALGPSVFGQIAPDQFQMFAGPATLAPLAGLAAVAVLFSRSFPACMSIRIYSTVENRLYGRQWPRASPRP